MDRKPLFLKKIQKVGDCWIWQGAVQKSNGYGRFSMGDGHVIYAHRAAHLLFKGPIPTGLHVCHTCDVRTCVNPDHLFLGTRFDNMGDAKAKGRLLSGWDLVKLNPQRKLDPRKVEEIRSQLAAGGSLRTVAKEFGVSSSRIAAIKTGISWRFVGSDVGHNHEEQANAAGR